MFQVNRSPFGVPLLLALVFVLCCASTSVFGQSGWWCYYLENGEHSATPVRLASNGEVECASADGSNCNWYSSLSICMANMPTSATSVSVNPLQCGIEHQIYYGSSGYDNDHHWCLSGLFHFNPAIRAQAVVSLSLAAPVPASTSDWRCTIQNAPLTVHYTPTRVGINGEIECMASDSSNCMWYSQLSDCNNRASNPVSPLLPLQCGSMHQKIYGGSGYSNPGHWCMQGLIDRKQVIRDDIKLYLTQAGDANYNNSSTNGNSPSPSASCAAQPGDALATRENVIVPGHVCSIDPLFHPSSRVYNLTNDFRLTSNPAGPWSYCTRSTILGTDCLPMQLQKRLDSPSGNYVPYWTNSSVGYPLVGKNTGLFDYSVGSPAVTIPAGEMVMHPWTNCPAIARLTIAESGWYDVSVAISRFGGLIGGIARFSLVLNASLVYDEIAFTPYTFQPARCSLLFLTTGSMLDFVVDIGDGVTYSDTTGIRATVSKRFLLPASSTGSTSIGSSTGAAAPVISSTGSSRQTCPLPNGQVFRCLDDGLRYILTNGTMRLISTDNILAMIGNPPVTDTSATICSVARSACPQGTPLTNLLPSAISDSVRSLSTNLALGASGTLDPPPHAPDWSVLFSPSKCTDGDLSTFCHSNCGGTQQQLQIQLNAPVMMGGVRLWNRLDGARDRINGFRLYASMDTGAISAATLVYSDPSTARHELDPSEGEGYPIFIPFPSQGIRAQVITVVLPSDICLNLQEVQIVPWVPIVSSPSSSTGGNNLRSSTGITGPSSSVNNSSIAPAPLVAFLFTNSSLRDESGSFALSTVTVPAGVGVSVTSSITAPDFSFVSDRCGRPRSALNMRYGGRTYFQSAVSSLPLNNAPRSVAMWLRCTTHGSAPVERSTVQWGTRTSNHNSGLLVDATVLSMPYFVGEYNDVLAVDPVCNNSWHHVAYSYDGRTVRIFVDGRVSKSADIPPLATVASDLHVGWYPAYTTTGLFDGDLDDIRVWNTSISNDQVATLVMRDACSTSDQTGRGSSTASAGSTAGAISSTAADQRPPNTPTSDSNSSASPPTSTPAISSTGPVSTETVVQVVITIELVVFTSDAERVAALQQLLNEIAAKLSISANRIANLTLSDSNGASRRLLQAESRISFLITPRTDSAEATSIDCATRLRDALQTDSVAGSSLELLGRKVASVSVEQLAECVGCSSSSNGESMESTIGTMPSSGSQWSSWKIALICVGGVALIAAIAVGCYFLHRSFQRRSVATGNEVSRLPPLSIASVVPEKQHNNARIERFDDPISSMP